jgi:hypothetical protein
MSLIMQNKPNFPKCRNKRILNHNKDLRKSPTYQPTKQIQFSQRQNNLNLCHRKDLRNQTPLCEKRSTNYAKQTQFPDCPNEHNHSYRKDLQGFSTFRTPKKQTQSNPISNLLFASLPPENPLCCSKKLVFNSSKIYNSLRLFAISIKMEITI